MTPADQAPAEGSVYYAGADARTAASLASALGRDVRRALPSAPADGDVIVLEAYASHPDLIGGNAFATCRAFKERGRARVFVLVRAGDPHSAEIARACHADGAFTVAADGTLEPGHGLQEQLGPRRRPQLDSLLERLEREISSDSGKHASAIQKMLAPDQHQWVLRQFSDPETGLLRADFAAFRLEEEFKRALRLRQSLAAVLLDIGGEAALPQDPAGRRVVLAEIGSVLLNESRDIDVLGRFTASTFLILLPGTTLDGAVAFTRRLLANLGHRVFTPAVTLAPRAGIAMAPHPSITRRDQLLLRAEACLRAAQTGGGDGGLCAGEA